MPFSIISAMDSKRGIGKNNDIPWYIQEDFKWFKRQTTNKIVIMGDTTYYTLPEKFRPLPNRINVVLTLEDDKVKPLENDGCIVMRSVKEVYDKYKDEDCFIIGGGRIYLEFLSLSDTLYLTFIKGNFKCDTFFPKFDLRIWKLTYRSEPNHSDKGLKYTFNIFERKKLTEI